MPRPESGIKFEQAIGRLECIIGGHPDPGTPFGILGEGIQGLGQQIGNEIGKLFGSHNEPGPDGKRQEGLLTLSLPSQSKIDLSSDPSNVVTSSAGIDRPGILLFIKSSAGEWEGPFAPLHQFGWSRFEHPGHTGIPGGAIVIQAGVKNWSDVYAYDFLMKVFYR